MSLPKADPERRLEYEPWIRVFDFCPDCKKYIAPGFRTDMCPFCHADFVETPEYQEAIRRECWKCHICGEERPDDKISVLSKPLILSGQVVSGGQQNIRYCNDRPACIEGVKEFSFFKGSKEE